ncbi:MAG: ABC transporter ATP-binding protein [Muribaculaceae bacterium]
MSYLSTNNLCIGYRQKGHNAVILDNLNLSLERGSLVALLGANGAGKSTLLRTITAVQPPLGGSIEISGCDIFKLTQLERSRLIGIVNTDRVMVGALSVRELVSLGRQPYTGFLGRLSKHDKEIVNQAIADAGIAHKADCYVSQLSDGERQKAMIAKALAQKTPIIILDEPTAFLDVASRFETMRLLHNLAHSANKAILLSSHDISQSLLLADYVWAISSEKHVSAGNTEDLVLSGSIDNLFNSKALKFNRLSSDFETVLPHSAYASVQCSDTVLSHCISNALIRNGFAVQDHAPIQITATDKNNISLNGNTLHSIAELVAEIRKLK